MSQATIAPPEIRTVANRVKTAPAEIRTLGDLLRRLGGIPLDRIRFDPPPGTATEEDVLEVERRENRSCELIDGTLVEKALGAPESYVSWLLGHLLGHYLDRNNLGICLNPDGLLRNSPGLVRMPDLSFISWDKLPGRKVPLDPIWDLYPDLAIEIISKRNTPAEIQRKLSEYFKAGVRLAWVIDPRKRTARVHTSARRSTLVREHQSLDGGDVLPGFSVRLADVFKHLGAE
jgi:Uma2 family endonuclease